MSTASPPLLLALTRPAIGSSNSSAPRMVKCISLMPANVEAALAFRRTHNLNVHRILITQILLRHIFGVDKDAGAMAVARPTSGRKPSSSRPKITITACSRPRLSKLPNLELDFHCADWLVDVELEKQVQWLAEYHQAELKKLSEHRAGYIQNPMRHEALDEALALRKKDEAKFVEHLQGENLPCEPGGFALHFWPCWFNADEQKRGARASRSPIPASRRNPRVQQTENGETGVGRERSAARETRALPEMFPASTAFSAIHRGKGSEPFQGLHQLLSRKARFQQNRHGRPNVQQIA